MESDGNWRSQLLPEARQRIINKIRDTLKRHLPVTAADSLHELRKIAIRFEEKVYAAASNQSDYLRKISLKMLSMETKAVTATAFSPSHVNPPVGNQSPVESGQAVTENVKNQNIRKEAKEREAKEPRKRKSKKQKVDLPSPSETKQSIPSLLEQLIQAIAGQSSMHKQAFSPQHGSTSTPQQVLPLKQQQWTTPKVEDVKAELQSQLESSQNVIENLSKCIPLLQNQLVLERSSQVKIRSALDEIKIREASAKAQQNVSDAILHRELSNLARAVATFKEKGP